MDAAEGILTSTGGMTSHAALVARQMGKVCMAGGPDALVNYDTNRLTDGGTLYEEGDYISHNGSTGEVLDGEIQTDPSEGMSSGPTYPEVTQMQARAILEAAVDVSQAGIDVVPEIILRPGTLNS